MRLNLFLVVFLFIPFLTSGQEITTIYYGVNGRIVNDRENALVYKEVKMKGGDRARIRTYRLSAQGWIQTRFEAIGKKRDQVRLIRFREGTFFPRTYRREITTVDDQVIFFTDYKGERVLKKGSSLSEFPLHLEGSVSVYHKNGNIASTSSYSNNILLSNQNWNRDGTPYIHDIFYSADQPPVHPYGQTFIQNYITNTMAEAEFPIHEVHDDILLGCVILETGELDGVRILKGKVESVNKFFKETMESLPGTWEPAVLNGKKVRYFITMPISLISDMPTLQHVELTRGGQIFWHD